MNMDWPVGTACLRGKRPPVGRLINYQDAVWRVDDVKLIDLDDDDREVWVSYGMPDLDTWCTAPYRVEVSFVGGRHPYGGENPVDKGCIDVHTRYTTVWYLYPESGRWPQCSCCGEPMPCLADRTDTYVNAQVARLARLESVMPGCCWGCHEPITKRQRFVAYPGDNLDLPGGPPVTFHTRRDCHWQAQNYEVRWLTAGPNRQRILTWPKCHGTLVVHASGDSECFDGELDCRGHDTHDHSHIVACYTLGLGCPRECVFDSHPGCSPRRRAKRSGDTI